MQSSTHNQTGKEYGAFRLKSFCFRQTTTLGNGNRFRKSSETLLNDDFRSAVGFGFASQSRTTAWESRTRCQQNRANPTGSDSSERLSGGRAENPKAAAQTADRACRTA